MLFSSIIMTVLLSSLTIAVPTAFKRQGNCTYDPIEVVFTGAAGAFYTMSVVTNNAIVPTNNSLSISSVQMFGRADFTCNFFGIDGSVIGLEADLVRTDPLKLSMPVCFVKFVARIGFDWHSHLVANWCWPAANPDCGSVLFSTYWLFYSLLRWVTG